MLRRERKRLITKRRGAIMAPDRACLEVGVKPVSGTYDGKDPLGFVISANLHRRHLDASQRAMIAAEIANLTEGRPNKTASIQAVSQTKAAAKMNVSRSAVQQAAVVRTHGSPELVEQVKQGKVKVSKAAAIVRPRSGRGGRPKDPEKARCEAMRIDAKIARDPDDRSVQAKSDEETHLYGLKQKWISAMPGARKSFMEWINTVRKGDGYNVVTRDSEVQSRHREIIKNMKPLDEIQKEFSEELARTTCSDPNIKTLEEIDLAGKSLVVAARKSNAHTVPQLLSWFERFSSKGLAEAVRKSDREEFLSTSGCKELHEAAE